MWKEGFFKSFSALHTLGCNQISIQIKAIVFLLFWRALLCLVLWCLHHILVDIELEMKSSLWYFHAFFICQYCFLISIVYVYIAIGIVNVITWKAQQIISGKPNEGKTLEKILLYQQMDNDQSYYKSIMIMLFSELAKKGLGLTILHAKVIPTCPNCCNNISYFGTSFE